MILQAQRETRRKSFTLEQYHQMICSGVLVEGDSEGSLLRNRVELIDGEILERAAIGSKHSAQVNRLNRVFSKRLMLKGLDEEVLISVQNPVELGPRSEPQPDIAWLRGLEDRYENNHPQPADVLLIVRPVVKLRDNS